MTQSNEWRPAARFETLQARAKMYALIRNFFELRGVLEVDTPVLSQRGVTDPALMAMQTGFNLPGTQALDPLYLQTSPEFAMKRLLAAGSGSIYQIFRAFRNEERGRFHHPEFTLLEWYRVGFTLDDLMTEVEALLRVLLNDQAAKTPARRVSYQELFHQSLHLDPLASSLDAFADRSSELGVRDAYQLCGEDRSVWLDFLFSHFVQPALAPEEMTFVYHFPSILPSLARTVPGFPEWVERVELFMGGIELANGFHELADDGEQRLRFEADNEKRKLLGLPLMHLDDRLLSAIAEGLPDCSGIALGLDRLLMVVLKLESIDATLAFPLETA